MTSKYAQAVLELLLKGVAVDAVLSGLRDSLKQNRHEKLYGKILKELQRELSGRAGRSDVQITLATKADENTLKDEIATSLKALGVAQDETTIAIDDTIIGGHIVTAKAERIDRSYKQALLRLYRNVTEKA